MTVILCTSALAFAQTHTDAHGSKPGEPKAQMNMSDDQFVNMTIQHHKDGIEMARAAESQATSQEVKTLAAKIRAGQERELKELESMGSGGNATGTAGHDDHQMSMMQDSKKSVERVKNASGKDVARAFLEEMVKHHQMAIDMVQHTKFDNAQLKKMANEMRASQTRELQELKSARQRVS